MKIELIFWALIFALNGLSDRILFYPEQFSGWWKRTDSKNWTKWQFLFAPVVDGWHFSKWLMFVLIYLAINWPVDLAFIFDWKFHILWAAVAFAAHEIAMKGYINTNKKKG